VAVGMIGSVVTYNTLNFTSLQLKLPAVEQPPISDDAVQRLSDAIRFPTVSFPDRIDSSAFRQFKSYVKRSYPLVDSLLQLTTVNDFSLLYKWPGQTQSLQPILLMAHIDVVPVDEKQAAQWTQPPFSGAVTDGYIWGRGALDDKVNIMAVLEAFELLLAQGYQPQRSIYLACGHDEEIGGTNGARAIARRLEQQGVRLEYVLDEGSVIITDALKGLNQPAALIGTSEKGYVTLRLDVHLEEGGHSSMPPQQSAISILTKAVTQLTDHPFPARMNGPIRPLLEQLGPEMEQPFKSIFANLWLFKGAVKQQLAASPSTNAVLRTTTAPTVIEGGFKENVLPTDASAKINFRILPGETIESTISYVRTIIADTRVEVRTENTGFKADPSPVSSTDAFGFQVVQKTCKEIFPQVVAVPALVIAGTDSRHYQPVCDNIYRFLPVHLSKADLKRIHGFDERIGVEAYKDMIGFYRQLLLNSTK
ncbi:MAG: M20 family peptidase, partial [Bacteroidota bacterium]